jgi:hypothetical protein
LPNDKIKALYDGINQDLVVSYLVNGDEYAIPKKEEQIFLKDYPTAKLLSPSSKGYSFFKHTEYNSPLLNEDRLLVFQKDPLRILIKDSTFVFDYLKLSEFKILLKDSSYRSKFYSTFSKDYDLGTRQSFESKIDTGFKFNNNIISKKQNLLNEKQLIQASLSLFKDSINDNKEILNITLWTFLILAIIVYPLRLCFKLLKWSIKTVRQNTT